MTEIKKLRWQADGPTRRQVIGGGAIALAGLAAGAAHGQDQKPMAEAQSSGADAMRTSLHQEVVFNASPHRIYEIFLDAKQFAAFTGMPAAEVSHEAGGAFSMFGGMIVGRNIELVPDQRIVQAWRPANWDPGVYSVVKFEFKAQGSKTSLVLDHTGFPEGDYAHLGPGWKMRYWDPLAKYLG
jgi:activator of HSP90 ATPase